MKQETEEERQDRRREKYSVTGDRRRKGLKTEMKRNNCGTETVRKMQRKR